MHRLAIQTEVMLYQFRKQIPTDCSTAKSIDRNDPWDRVATFAKDDGFLKLAEQLEKSKYQLLEQTH
ncbi:MAG: hypothetical protein AUK53_09650 [Betaproteobacteria bacterium CG2_30_59_46]|nr:MAG: hypothetical protein AUK53_09650 [Betaproteobacteria bacterium CG2_30_59_46]PIQ13458.1 MAG: hypothetical protein COW70_04580 [Hydrogenophilales bacterium CG18_big_fil_WC_8_21_14_2_50_58_12]PJB08696.1 MAG: hypothetical protein CO125_00915 [Hydrogenophilales bacterium CG_4_9_14_3_um_filter_59_35]